MTITAGSLLTDSWNIIKDILYDKLSDIGTSRSGSEFVVSAWPNRTDYPRRKWLAYPFVVLTNEVDSENNFTMNRSNVIKTVTFHADVYHKSQANVDKMTNQIMEILDISAQGLTGSGLLNYRIESMSSTDITDPSNALVHQKTLNWVYDYIAEK